MCADIVFRLEPDLELIVRQRFLHQLCNHFLLDPLLLELFIVNADIVAHLDGFHLGSVRVRHKSWDGRGIVCRWQGAKAEMITHMDVVALACQKGRVGSEFFRCSAKCHAFIESSEEIKVRQFRGKSVDEDPRIFCAHPLDELANAAGNCLWV